MAGKIFQMGAKMTLKDQFRSTISNITRSTIGFKRSVDDTNKSVKSFKDATGRLHDETGKFVSKGNQAAATARVWFNSNGKLTASLGIVKKGLAGIATYFGIMKAKNWLVDSNADMETYKNTLTVVLKDQKKAVDMLAWATKFAAQTPFEIPEIVEATTRMQSYGINAQKTLGIVGDMASVMGKDLMSAVEAVADAQTGEVERLKEFGITKQMIAAQAKLMKLTVTNNQGQITDQKAFNAALFALMEKRYKGGMEMQSKTFKGMMSNAADFIGSVGRTLGAPVFDAAKRGLGSLLDWASKLQQSGGIDAFAKKIANLVGVVIQVFGFVKRYVVGVIQNITNKVVAWYNDNKAKIDAIGVVFQRAFLSLASFAAPILAWLKDTAIPGLVSVLGTVASLVLSVANFFINNWSWIGPIIEGIVIALGAYYAIVGAIMAVTKVWAVIQGILNAVMALNPVMLIVIAIGILIGLIILLVKNWDVVKAALISGAQAIGNFFVGIWNWIKNTAVSIFNAVVGFFKKWGLTILAIILGPMGLIGLAIYKNFDAIKAFLGSVAAWIQTAFQNVGNFIANVFKGLVNVLKAPVNFIISAINALLGGLNGLNIDIPSWVPLVGGKKFGFNIPLIPYLAKGTDNWQGGPAFMNERGGELAILPNGSQVIPADKTDKILDKPRGGTNIKNLIGELHIHQQPGEDAEGMATRIIEIIYDKLKDAAEIANNAEMGVLLNG